jgi:NADP-dependent 3-hydroxy acid dehydrogenase YdfG
MAQTFGGIEIMQAEDIAESIRYAVTQPRRVVVNEILIRPTEQER